VTTGEARQHAHWLRPGNSEGVDHGWHGFDPYNKALIIHLSAFPTAKYCWSPAATALWMPKHSPQLVPNHEQSRMAAGYHRGISHRGGIGVHSETLDRIRLIPLL